jgi:Asp/Glu/hydantoin racemase
MAATLIRPTIRLLVINPNSSLSMTQGMEKAIGAMNLPDVRFTPQCIT